MSFVSFSLAVIFIMRPLAFLGNKKIQKNHAFFSQKDLTLEKTLSDLHIHYKSLLKRVYNLAGAQNTEKNLLLP